MGIPRFELSVVLLFLAPYRRGYDGRVCAVLLGRWLVVTTHNGSNDGLNPLDKPLY